MKYFYQPSNTKKIMLKIDESITDKLAKAKALAEETNDPTLQRCLDRLDQYGRDGGYTFLYGDFCPHCFGYTVYRADGSRSFNGGLNYHGSPDQSCSIRIGEHEGCWSIHT